MEELNSTGASSEHALTMKRQKLQRLPRRMEKVDLLPSAVLDELVDASCRHIEDILKCVSDLIATEVDPSRKDRLMKIQQNALKERANFRVLLRHVVAAASAPKDSRDDANATDAAADADNVDDDLAKWRKDFRGLPDKLAAKFSRDLPV